MSEKRKTPEENILEVGAGQNPTEEATITLDIREDLDHIDHGGVDIGDDEWPIEESSISEVIANHVFEHIPPENIGHVFSEIDRVLISGGQFRMRTPHAGTWASATDPTHQGTGGTTPDITKYFTGELEEYWPHLDWNVEAWTQIEFPLFLRSRFRVTKKVYNGVWAHQILKIPFVTGEVFFEAKKR
ncbi:methyltransferase domain-containing protein [Haloparvum sp. PAK95]|uniref:methyltransferase domain-containing protein n=1 Tax=Haloparvum sp. PAK95 TaxID=3418962 RepID=UPI003D2F07EC